MLIGGHTEVILRLVLALISGGILGYERSRKRIDAGFRTHILVCMSSCAIMITNVHTYLYYQTGDPVRMPAQVISGVGFLGAGCILVTGQHRIKGVTTAAGLWSSACIGLCIGAGDYIVAGFVLAAVFITMTLFRMVDDNVFKASRYLRFYTEFDSVPAMTAFIRELRKRGMKVSDIEPIDGKVTSGPAALFRILLKNTGSSRQIIDELEKMDGIVYIMEL